MAAPKREELNLMGDAPRTRRFSQLSRVLAIEQIVAENHHDSESCNEARRPNQNQATENDHRDSNDPDDLKAGERKAKA